MGRKKENLSFGHIILEITDRGVLSSSEVTQEVWAAALIW